MGFGLSPTLSLTSSVTIHTFLYLHKPQLLDLKDGANITKSQAAVWTEWHVSRVQYNESTLECFRTCTVTLSCVPDTGPPHSLCLSSPGDCLRSPDRSPSRSSGSSLPADLPAHRRPSPEILPGAPTFFSKESSLSLKTPAFSLSPSFREYGDVPLRFPE